MILLILTSSAFIIQVCRFYPQGPVGANTGCTSEHRPIPDVLNLTSPLLPSPQCRPSFDQVQRTSGPSHAPSNLGLGQDAALVSTAVIQSRSSLSRSILFGALIAVWQVLQRSAYRQSLCTRMGLQEARPLYVWGPALFPYPSELKASVTTKKCLSTELEGLSMIF